MRTLAILLALLGAACATAPPQPPLGEQVIGSLNVAEAQGLSQDELRQRLGLSARAEDRLSVIYLDDGQVAYIVNREDLLRGSQCPPREGRPYTRMMIRGPDAFVFQNGRLQAALSGGVYRDWTTGRPVNPEARISLSCWYPSRRGDGGNVVGDLITVAPWIPLLAVVAPLALLPDREEQVLATVRVGEQLPGGYQQFLNDNRASVQLESAAGSDVELGVRTRGQPEATALARIYLRDGVVVRIQLRSACLLYDERSVHCGD